MDDFKDGFAAGWSAAIAEAERRCERIWFPTGEQGRGVGVTELVQIRRMPEAAKGADRD